jgi:hypothetical protein
MDIAYTLSVPDSYKAFIYSLAEEYAITLSPREEHIL